MWIITILFNIFLFTAISGDDSDLRIVSGRETFQRFLVGLYIKVPNEHITCSASIIDRNWVITSGHCFDDGPLLYVLINGFTAPSRVMAVDRIIVHPLYHHNKLNGLLDYVKHDLALLKLSKPIDLNGYVQPVPLDSNLPVEGQAVTVSGFGLPDLEAREGDMHISYCNSFLCSHTLDEEPRPALGDSGGPLLANGKLIGVDSSSVQIKVTQNKRRQRVFHTEYFADIASNYDWIQSVINEWPNDASRLLRSG